MDNYLLIVESDGDEKIKGKSMYGYATRDEAVANYHSKLGTAMKSELYTSIFIMVVSTMEIDEPIEKCRYDRPTE